MSAFLEDCLEKAEDAPEPYGALIEELVKRLKVACHELRCITQSIGHPAFARTADRLLEPFEDD